MKISRLQQKLDAAISKERDPFLRDCLRAERAGYLARRGDIDDATATLIELRATYERMPNAEMSVRLNLSEGLVIQFSNMGEKARDKFHRAYALGAATGLIQLSALCAAWLAHIDYLLADVNGMVRHLGLALTLAGEQNYSARSRASLVVADAYHLAGRLDLGRPWYAKAHQYAAVEGDDATISAIMHNMAWLRAANLRQSALSGAEPSASGDHALVSADSTLQFDSLFGTKSLPALAPVLRAQILSIESKYLEALAIYDEYLIPAVLQGMGLQHASLLADQAWCRVNLGQIELGATDAKRAEALIGSNGTFDDRAPAHSRLAQVFGYLRDSEAATRHAQLAKIAWGGHEKHQQRIIEGLADLRIAA